LPFRYSLFFFLNVLLVSCLKFFILFPLIWLGFCNHCNLPASVGLSILGTYHETMVYYALASDILDYLWLRS
jgi:hypothetical protein